MTGRFDFSATVAGTVGTGFEAYARILHPIPARRFDLDPSHRDNYGMRAITEEKTWPWAELARRNGPVMHPLVQWRRLTDDESRMSFADGWDAEQVREGFLEPGVLAELIGAVSDTTDTATGLTVGIWEGWGELQGNGVVYTESGEADAEAQASYVADVRNRVAPEVREVMNTIQKEHARSFRRRRRPSAPPLLELPHRRYLLFASSVSELSDPSWPLSAGIGWSEETTGVTPQLVWPRDSAWCIATEIDFVLTLVGGPRTAIERILASAHLEAFEVEPTDDMTWDGDTVNETRDPAPDHGNPFP
jgi:hypothetical protein